MGWGRAGQGAEGSFGFAIPPAGCITPDARPALPWRLRDKSWRGESPGRKRLAVLLLFACMVQVDSCLRCSRAPQSLKNQSKALRAAKKQTDALLKPRHFAEKVSVKVRY